MQSEYINTVHKDCKQGQILPKITWDEKSKSSGHESEI